MQQLSSPNHDERGDVPIDMLVLHYTGMPTGEAAIKRLCDAEAKVSAHYVVEENGEVFQLVPEERRAWHAGVSYWRGHTNVNARSIGIEIVNPGHEFGYRAFPNVQMKAVSALCQSILMRHAITARNVVGHSDIAPARKEDPGELFPWKWLAEEGVGLFPELPHIAPLRTPEETRRRLREYGYDTSLEDAPLYRAFQRHFRPQPLTGIWDKECEGLLSALHALIS